MSLALEGDLLWNAAVMFNFIFYVSAHIHPGNIAIENQKVLLLDIENVLMGVPCLYRPYLLELRHNTTAEAIDVYCFGHTLYEMAFAAPLEQYYCDFYPEEICGGDLGN